MRPARRKAIRSHEQLGQAEDLIRYTPFMKRFLHVEGDYGAIIVSSANLWLAEEAVREAQDLIQNARVLDEHRVRVGVFCDCLFIGALQ